MSPIDDELRAALHGRAQVLAPSPDPLVGIEARARRIQRTRIGTAVAGSALAVAAIAAVVPAIQGATSTAPAPERFARTGPTEEHTTDTSAYALDPARPWAYRGLPLEQLGQGSLRTIEKEYAVRHPEAVAAAPEITPLFGRTRETSGSFELVFLAKVGDGYRWGVAQSSEAGPEFLVDEPLAEPALALAAALPAPDDFARLLVVAAPDVGGISYRPERGSDLSAMQELARGVALVAMSPSAATDAYVVVDPQGQTLVEAEAPNAGTEPGPGADGQSTAALDPDAPWEVRGDPSLITDGQLQALGEDWAQRHGVDPGKVRVQPLYVQPYEPAAAVEVVYLVRFRDNPWMWGVSSLQQGRWSWYAENELAPGTTALAAALPGDEGAERLLVVGAPSLGGAVYAAAPEEFAPMEDVAPGVFVTTIRPGDPDDSFKVVDGDGNLDDPLFEGPAPDFQNAG